MDNVATVPGETFLQRFVQHVLPTGFTRIRHYGLLVTTDLRGSHFHQHHRRPGSVPAGPHDVRVTGGMYFTEHVTVAAGETRVVIRDGERDE